MKNIWKVSVLLLGLSGCGSIYRSSDVIPGDNEASKVRVLPVTAETVLQANRSPFTPKTLPAVFSMTAGTGGGQSYSPSVGQDLA